MAGLPQRIVYVDDDQDMRSLMRELFERQEEEYSFTACGSGQELLNRFRILQPELILLDLRMPEMNGPDTIEKLQAMEDADGVPIIFVTGAPKLEMTETYKKLGVIGLIRKPFDFSGVLDSIQAMWDEHQAAVEE